MFIAYIPFVFNNLTKDDIIASINQYMPDASIQDIDLIDRTKTQHDKPDIKYFIAFAKFDTIGDTIKNLIEQGRQISVPVVSSARTKQKEFHLKKYVPKQPTTDAPTVITAPSAPTTTSTAPTTSTTPTTTTAPPTVTTTTPIIADIPCIVPSVEQRLTQLEALHFHSAHTIHALLHKIHELETEVFNLQQIIVDTHFQEMSVQDQIEKELMDEYL